VIRRTMVGAVALTMMLALATAGVAATRMTVAQTIVAQDKVFIASPGYKLLGNFKVKTAAQAKSAIPKLRHTKLLLSRAAAAVSHAPATTTAEKNGRRYWVNGAHMVATGIGDLATGLQYLVSGNKTKADKILKQSVVIDRKGGLLAAKGDTLLGLPTTD
jgi:hypothetical protein